ncbi:MULTISPECIES: TetR/AcrR family transcriptional regulator [unclassified Xanthobacter]|uniref:TetR/AcrR family transcriptional regulator n=1 Tax=unclassified Xanthobacter TaxID=2623496 RepID=UPI001F2936E3|nr:MULTISPECIES: TetR/AcrR family transcriptional regulator [unclassified Xanthobacter]
MSEQAPSPARKGRRRRKEARPQEIIAAGLAEFAEHGFEATRLEDVAIRAGIVKGTIYRYFDSKDALFEAALWSGIAPAFETLRQVVVSYEGSTFDLLTLLIERLYATVFTSDVELLARIIISEGRRFPVISKLYHQLLVCHGREILHRAIERGIARGEIAPSPLTETPEALIGPMVMALVWQMIFAHLDPIEPARFLEAHRYMLKLVLADTELKERSEEVDK